MGILFKRIISFAFALGGWSLAAIRTALDVIGWSTAPDDFDGAMTKADQIFMWLLALPWFVPWGFALISTMWLMWVSWPRQQKFGEREDREVDLNIEQKNLEVIANQKFVRAPIKIDGKRFINCEFEHVFIIWDGGPYSFENSKIEPARVDGFQTNNPALRDTIHLFGLVGLLHPKGLAGMGIPMDPVDAAVFARPLDHAHDEKNGFGSPSWAKSDPESSLTLLFDKNGIPKMTEIRNVKKFSHYTDENGSFNLSIEYENSIKDIKSRFVSDKSDVVCNLIESGTHGAIYKLTGELGGMTLHVQSGFSD